MKLLITIIFTLFTISVFAQEKVELTKRSEIKVNALYVILGGIELDYEYIINEESSVGISVTSFFDDDVEYNWGVTPHYRLFFGKQPALGFFVEGHASVFGYDPYNYYDFNTGTIRNSSSKTFGGVGIAVGGKFKTSRDIVVEVNGGLGRIFGNDDFIGAYPRFGINIGKRF